MTPREELEIRRNIQAAISAGDAKAELKARRRLQSRAAKPETGKERIAFRGDVPYLTRSPAPPRPPEPGLGEQAVGLGEAALTMGTGATGGLLGMLGGTAAGVASNLPQFGSQEAADAIQQQAMQGAGMLTYAPRTEMGQQYLKSMEPILGVIPPVIGGVGIPPKPSRPQIPMPSKRQAPVLDSVGASRLAEEQAMVQRASMMPVPFEGPSAPTLGQRTRNFQQLQFEKEAAKLAEAGEPLRERLANERRTLFQNMNELHERQRPQAVESREIGASVDTAIRARKEKVSQDVKSAYEQARQAGEMQEPASLTNLGSVFDEMADFEGLSGAELLPAAKRKAVNMGIASVDDNGNLMFADAVPIDRIETFRQFINDASDVTVPRSAMIRRRIVDVIDNATEDKGGPLYQRARRKAASKYREFDRSRLTKQILGTKRGTDERAIALENIAQDVIVNAPVDELNKLRGTLLRAGDQGKQAWQDLKAYGISHISKKAFGEQIDDQRTPIAKPAMFLRAVEKFDESGKLQALYGKRQAQIMRDLAELTRLLETAPPGAINHSNTSSAAINAVVEMGLMGSLTGVPAPLMATLKQASKFVKNTALKNRINKALKTD